jgi:hypothetical protein
MIAIYKSISELTRALVTRRHKTVSDLTRNGPCFVTASYLFSFWRLLPFATTSEPGFGKDDNDYGYVITYEFHGFMALL